MLDACSKQEKPVDARLFSSINLTEQQFGIALSYLSIKANNSCIQHAAGQFTIATRVMQQTRPRNTSTPDQSINDYANLVAGSVLREIQLQAEFQALPDTLRKKLENISELARPFDAVATLENLASARK